MDINELIKIRLELSQANVETQNKPMKNPIIDKENFVIPKPQKDERQDDYVNRCMDAIGGENKPQDQLVAICIATYKSK